MKKFMAVLLSAVMLTLSLSSCGEAKSKNPERPDDIPMQETSDRHPGMPPGTQADPTAGSRRSHRDPAFSDPPGR